MDDEQLDFLAFCVFGVRPNVNLCSLAVKTHEDLRAALAKEGRQLEKEEPGRLANLAPDFCNVGAVAMLLGYPAEALSPARKQQLPGLG